MGNQDGRRWMDALSDEDLVFLRHFLLASGSLKEVAGIYGISYPTVRLRLDRLIQKVELLGQDPPGDAFEQTLRAQYADGRFDLATLKRLLAAYREQRGEKP